MIYGKVSFLSLIFKILAIYTQFEKVIPNFTIPIFKTIMKFMALRIFDNVGKKTEIISKGKQGIFMNFEFILTTQVCKDPSVLSQQTMNIPYKIV
jgi:hypothetical protein